MTGTPIVAVNQDIRRSRGARAVHAERAAWLAEEILLVVCGAATAHSELSPDAPSTTFEARRLAGGNVADGGAATARVYAAKIPAGTLEDLSGLFGLQVDDEPVVCEGPALLEALTDIRSLVREQLAVWSPAAREQLLADLSSLAARHALSRSLSDGLFGMREALRERQPVAVLDAGAERVVQVEQIHRVDRNSFYVRGWLWESSPPPARLAAISPEGERIELLDEMLRQPRPDVVQRLGLGSDAREEEVSGFICHFGTGAPSRRADGWVVELANAAGRGVETAAALASTDLDAAREAIVADVELEAVDRDTLIERHVHPALTRLQGLQHGRVAIATSDCHGNSPSRPDVSIVVPLDRRIDLLEHQLAQFADDPELRACELIYVLHCPDRSEQLRELALGLFSLYGLPFRVITLTADGGSALATNIGAGVAAGGRLLLLNREVMPVRHGWLGRLSTFYAATPGIGALAPKLVYQDGTIDHAGLDFIRADSASEWAPRARFRGLHGRLPAANVAGAVPAVGQECLMVDAETFSELEGLCPQYRTGGYPGADLCLRLGEAGLESWYLPQVELYRLDGDAQPPDAERASELYDRWLLSRRHSRSIEAARSAIPSEASRHARAGGAT